MRNRNFNLRACPLIAFLTLNAPSWAAQDPVPIEHEPRHRLKFENEHVRFFDVELEPGYVALYHWHTNDGVFVNISPSDTTAQDWGGEPVERGWRAMGETYFIGYAAKPKAHRVWNSGDRPYRVTDTEILKGCDAGAEVAHSPNQTLIVENPRVTVTRIMLHPGEATELNPRCGMLVSVSGGEIELISPAGVERTSVSRAGFRWRNSQQGSRLTNIGRNVFHAVDIRVKR